MSKILTRSLIAMAVITLSRVIQPIFRLNRAHRTVMMILQPIIRLPHMSLHQPLPNRMVRGSILGRTLVTILGHLIAVVRTAVVRIAVARLRAVAVAVVAVVAVAVVTDFFASRIAFSITERLSVMENLTVSTVHWLGRYHTNVWLKHTGDVTITTIIYADHVCLNLWPVVVRQDIAVICYPHLVERFLSYSSPTVVDDVASIVMQHSESIVRIP